MRGGHDTAHPLGRGWGLLWAVEGKGPGGLALGLDTGGRGEVLTALDGVGGHLQRQPCRWVAGCGRGRPAAPACSFSRHVRLPLAQLDVGVPELQDPGTVDARDKRACLSPQPCPTPTHLSGWPHVHPSCGTAKEQDKPALTHPGLAGRAPLAQEGPLAVGRCGCPRRRHPRPGKPPLPKSLGVSSPQLRILDLLGPL